MSAKRIAILDRELAGYTLACLRILKQNFKVVTMVFHYSPAANAPFDHGNIEGIDYTYNRKDYTFKQMLEIVEQFGPQIIKIGSWMDPAYLKIGRLYKKKGIPVIAGLNTQSDGSVGQRLYRQYVPLYLKRCIDYLWVTGDRQTAYAKKLGYNGNQIRYGLFCCDWNRFAPSFYMTENKSEDAFLFVGKYTSSKGVEDLLNAYRNYRRSADNPWKLYCAGDGVLKGKIEREPGVENFGFIQPKNLPKLMQKSKALVLPSLVETWGISIQEATAAGLPILCSDVCGAGGHLVQDNYNGFVF
ncbi:MAG: glycosyltransferase, partial [Balneolales bacterium]